MNLSTFRGALDPACTRGTRGVVSARSGAGSAYRASMLTRNAKCSCTSGAPSNSRRPARLACARADRLKELDAPEPFVTVDGLA